MVTCPPTTPSPTRIGQSVNRFSPSSKRHSPRKSPLNTPSPNRKSVQNYPSSNSASRLANHRRSNSGPLEPPPLTSYSPGSLTSSSPREGERRSFQGDHHRYRFMGYGQQISPQRSPQSLQMMSHRSSPGQPSPARRSDASPKNNPRGPRDDRRQSRGPPQPVMVQHLGAPSNAHYSPHYGSPAQRAPTGKRKPPPQVTPSDPNLCSPELSGRALTPESPSPSSRRHQAEEIRASPSPSPSRSPASNHKLRKSRSPSPNSRGPGFVKKLSSVITSPFKSSSSRRESNASEIGLGTFESCRSPVSGNINYHENDERDLSQQDKLPIMPTASSGYPESSPIDSQQSRGLTPAEQIIHDTRTNDFVVVPNTEKQVLRVVNGCPTTSTKVSARPRPDLASAFDQLEENHSQAPVKKPSSFSLKQPVVSCTRCAELEQKLNAQLRQNQDLERAFEFQTSKLDQLKNWSTAKIAALEQALTSQDSSLQDLQAQLYEVKGTPDLKSDYLIALQKDFVALHSRLTALEQKRRVPSPEALKETESQGSSSLNDGRESLSSQSPSTQPTSVGGRLTSSSSSIPSETSEPKRKPQSSTEPKTQERVLSPSPSTFKPSTVGLTTPRKPTTWKASSPANMASKLAPPPGSSPKSPGSHGCRSAPTTPSSRSPRPRYTSALGIRPSPINLRSSNAIGGEASQPSGENSKVVGASPVVPLNITRKSLYDPGVTEPVTPVTKHLGAWDILEKNKNQPKNDMRNFHSKRISVLGDRNVNTPPTTKAPISTRSESGVTKPLVIRGGNKKPVGDLIKMFDNK